jgi:hypothetical protein
LGLECWHVIISFRTLTTEVAGFRQNRCLSKTSTSYLVFQTERDTSVGTKAQMQWSKAVPRSPATLVAGECHEENRITLMDAGANFYLRVDLSGAVLCCIIQQVLHNLHQTDAVTKDFRRILLHAQQNVVIVQLSARDRSSSSSKTGAFTQFLISAVMVLLLIPLKMQGSSQYNGLYNIFDFGATGRLVDMLASLARVCWNEQAGILSLSICACANPRCRLHNF